MYKLKDIYERIFMKSFKAQEGIVCEILTPENLIYSKELTETLSCFTFSIILRGENTTFYNGRLFHLKRSDLFVSIPGNMVKIDSVSPDFKTITLIVEEKFAFSNPGFINIIHAAYLPDSSQNVARHELSSKDISALIINMMRIKEVISKSPAYKTEILHCIFHEFVLNILSALRDSGKEKQITKYTETLFIEFLKLAHSNYKEHHGIEFYADRLCVTSIYLSRVVKKLTGDTIVNYINKLLIMEAISLLGRSKLTISEIAGILNFANQSSFCKFFSKHKGISPSRYRKQIP